MPATLYCGSCFPFVCSRETSSATSAACVESHGMLVRAPGGMILRSKMSLKASTKQLTSATLFVDAVASSKALWFLSRITRRKKKHAGTHSFRACANPAAPHVPRPPSATLPPRRAGGPCPPQVREVARRILLDLPLRVRRGALRTLVLPHSTLAFRCSLCLKGRTHSFRACAVRSLTSLTSRAAPCYRDERSSTAFIKCSVACPDSTLSKSPARELHGLRQQDPTCAIGLFLDFNK